MRAHWGVAICWCLIVGEGFSLKRFLPRGLFGRSLIIIVAPIVLLLAIITYVLFERDLDTVSKPDLFILWMVVSAALLMGIAIIFLRNQVRPIERLARAADSFGKGRAVPDFKPYGATEVRRAAQAFITMRERIERHVSQRTEMLAGGNHDLKTPLTPLKLTLAMMPDDADASSMLH